MSTDLSGGQERDSADLARFGYQQELKRSLGLFSSFAVASVSYTHLTLPTKRIV